MAMQIENLKIFCDLAETESFTKTGQINGVTQSAVSQQIAALERQFKSLLIERSNKKFRLTREGELVYEYSKRIVQDFDELQFKVDELKGIISGSIRVATIYSIGLHELPVYVKRFLKTHPGVNVHVQYLRFNQVYEDVMSNTEDIGLVAFPVKDPRIDAVALRKDPMVLITNPAHAFARAPRISVQALRDQKFVGFDADVPSRRAIDRVLHDKDVRVNYVMEFDNVETVKRAVEIDAGVAIVPKLTVAQEVEKGTLAAIEFDDADFSRPIAAIYRKNKVLSPAMKEFLSVLKGDIAEPVKNKRQA
jgi:LysR family transcriptional regulator, transcriptional activator of the cysJI operon